MKAKEKRKVRGYKITDTAYGKAMKKAAKHKYPLAKLIENIVSAYGEGAVVSATKFENTPVKSKTK